MAGRGPLWRSLGWPNLARAREARRRNCEQRRAALTEAERRKQLAAGERWRKWRERQKAMQAARNDPALWDFVRSLAASTEPSLRALARQTYVTKKLVERGERMLGARERRNARVRQRQRLTRYGLAASNEKPGLGPPADPAPLSRPAPQHSPVLPLPAAVPRIGFIDIPLAGRGTRRVFCW